MTAAVSLLPAMTGSILPPPSISTLPDDDQRLIAGLSTKLSMQSVRARVQWLYYDGEQRMQNLGISVPPTLAGVQTVVDWPRICVDPLVDRANPAGFRLPDSTDIDDELAAHWEANDLDSEFPLSILDSLVVGRGYIIVGSPDEDGDSPIVTVESPLNLTMTWDPRKRMVTAAYQSYEVEGVYRAVLYTPDRTVSMSRQDLGAASWAVDNIDDHRFAEVPVVRLPNRSRTSDREGRSEITQAIKKTTDSACRTLLGMEVGREFYSVPHRWVIGASESNFQSADGTKKTPWDMAMSKMLAIEIDANGNTPTVGQFTAYDPSVFTKIIDEHAMLMSSYTGYPPDYFGQANKANPASADAIRVSLDALDRHGTKVQRTATPAVRRTGQLMWRFAHKGEPLPAEFKRLHVDWADATIQTPAATSDAITKQVGAGILPADSDVTLAKLNYSPLERKRIAQDRDAAQQLEAELTSSNAARQARAGNALANELEKAAMPAVPIEPGQSGR